MPTSTAIKNALCVLCLAALLSSCAHTSSPRPASAPTQASAEVRDTPRVWTGVECDDKSTTPLYMPHVKAARKLARPANDDGYFHVNILPTTQGSILWQTKCPAPLTIQHADPDDCVCDKDDLFTDESSLSIKSVGSGNYELLVTNLKNNPDLRAILTTGKPANEQSKQQTFWLQLVPGSSNLSGYEFYVYLEDTSQMTPPNHKRYRIEAIRTSDTACHSHRPDHSICPVDSGVPDPEYCSPTFPRLTSICARQTDTGGGNEPPGIP